MGEVTAGDVTAIDVIQENSNSNEMLMKGWLISSPMNA